jgi:hypothetical protein
MDDLFERLSLELEAQGKRGTNAQILFERKLTCEAINGAMAFGYQNTNPPPEADHWLAPFWNIGRKQAALEAKIAAAEKQEPVDFVFPPMPPAVVMHEKVGPLFDRLSMHFYASKCMSLAAPLPSDGWRKDAERYRWSIDIEENANTLHSIVLCHEGDTEKIGERVDEYRAALAKQQGQE